MADKSEAECVSKAETSIKEKNSGDDEVETISVKEQIDSSSKSSEKNALKSKKSDISDGPVPSKKKKIKLLVKATKEKHYVDSYDNAMIKDVKEAVSKAFKTSEDQVCLVFSGKIMKDEESLSEHNIKDGNTIHLVINTKPKPTESSEQAPTSNPAAFPFGLECFGGLTGLATMGLTEPDFLQLQQRMQTQLLGNPDLLRQIMNNPFVQSMMSNPECVRQMINTNPQMRQLIERNPAVGQILNNPDALRQTMEVARNPAMLQELIRSPDSLSTSTPSGIQIETRAKSEKESDVKPKSEAKDGIAAAENKGSPVKSEATSSGKQTSDSEATKSEDSKPPLSIPGGMFTATEMQSMMQQMIESPQALQNMLRVPYMRSVMEALAANPDMASQLLMNNPMLANNRQLREQIRPMVPNIMQQLQNPEIHNFMSNPEALRALSSIYQGLDQLQQTAPSVFQMFPGMQTPPPPPPPVSSPSSNGINNQDSENQSSNDPTSGQDFSQFMRLMVDAMTRHNNNSLSPEERYRSQLNQLQTMGFVNAEANLQALTATFGDINSAIERLIRPQL